MILRIQKLQRYAQPGSGRIARGCGVCLLVLVLVLGGSFGSAGARASSAEPPATEIAPFVLQNRSTFRVDRIERNPFIPINFLKDEPAEAAPQRFTIPKSAFRLTSIMLDPVEPLAIINGKSLGLGEEVAYDAGAGIVFNLKVLRIYDGGVELGFRGESLQVPLARKSRQ